MFFTIFSFHCIIMFLLSETSWTTKLAFCNIMLDSVTFNQEIQLSVIIKYSKIKPIYRKGQPLLPIKSGKLYSSLNVNPAVVKISQTFISNLDAFTSHSPPITPKIILYILLFLLYIT